MTPPNDDLQVLALCPECRDVFRNGSYVRNAYRCSNCDVARQVAVVTGDGERHALLTEDGLYRRLSAIADSRNGQIGARYLEEEHPELLANCVAHAGRYRTARRRLRRWLGRHRGSPPPAREDETFPFWSAPGEGLGAAPDPVGSATASGQTAKIAAIALRVRSRAPSLDDRCPYCHDVFEDADNDGQPDHAFLCDCGALFHVECRVELERCTTLGCEAAFERDGIEPEDDDDRSAPSIRVVERSPGEEAAVTLTREQASAVGTAITVVAAIAIFALAYTLIWVFK